MPKVETVEVNGVIVNVGDEESAAKWGKKGKAEDAPADDAADESADEAPKAKRKKKAE
jgi:hypothetical protein